LIWSKEKDIIAIEVQQGQVEVNRRAEILKDKISMMVRAFREISSEADGA